MEVDREFWGKVMPCLWRWTWRVVKVMPCWQVRCSRGRLHNGDHAGPAVREGLPETSSSQGGSAASGTSPGGLPQGAAAGAHQQTGQDWDWEAGKGLCVSFGTKWGMGKEPSLFIYFCIILFYNLIVPFGFLPWEIQVTFPFGSQLRQSCAIQTTVFCVFVFLKSVVSNFDMDFRIFNVHVWSVCIYIYICIYI